jgi:hypothetical protein
MITLTTLKQRLAKRFPNIYLVLFGLLLGGLGMLVGFYFVAKGTPEVVESDYASIAAARKMKRALSAWRHPEDYDQTDTEHFRTEFNTGLSLARNLADLPVEQEMMTKVNQLWEKNKSNPTKMSPEDMRDIRRSLDDFVVTNENQMNTRVVRSNEISKFVAGFGFIFFALAWFI